MIERTIIKQIFIEYLLNFKYCPRHIPVGLCSAEDRDKK